MQTVFRRLLEITCPEHLVLDEQGTSPAFEIRFKADGTIPFPQVILRTRGEEHLFREARVVSRTAPESGEYFYAVKVPAKLLSAGEVQVQVEGCRSEDLSRAEPADWIKAFATINIAALSDAAPSLSTPAVVVGNRPCPDPAGSSVAEAECKIYFGIHKHMHQPYYNATDPRHWDGQKDEIFGSRGGPYTHFLPTAVRHYIHGGLPHAGLSTSWSGSLIEQLHRCAKEGLCGGCFGGWNADLLSLAGEKTALGNPRVDFSAFGFFHPLMPLVPGRDTVKQIRWHQEIIQSTFGTAASSVLFPPETAFHVRMIPALLEAGVEVVIYDSIHRFRACKDYPYAGLQEGMLPPSPAEQVNPPAPSWLQLHNIWAGSKIAPSLLKPEVVAYEDPEGRAHKIIAVPAERYIGNEDARGGYGALQYPDVLGQVRQHLLKTGEYDPAHPPFFLLHSDGDNHGGGAESYYTHNTQQLVNWIRNDPRFELTTIRDYLQRFPPDQESAVHIEPGAWSGADNGDPRFMKWFSRYQEAYSPDLNSWAVLTALENAVHSVEDSCAESAHLADITRLLLTAQTSCYWYWTGQEIWDVQVTNAANYSFGRAKDEVDQILAAGIDRTPPAIFPPWITPENPGGKTWGQGCLEDAPRQGTVHTFVHDIAGLRDVHLVLRTSSGEQSLKMKNRGPYPSQTGAAVTADYFTAELPVGAGDIRYYIEATDNKGNTARTALERAFLA